MAYTTIDNPELYFQCEIWTGNDASPRAFTLDGDEDMYEDILYESLNLGNSSFNNSPSKSLFRPDALTSQLQLTVSISP